MVSSEQSADSGKIPLSWSLHCGGACSQKALTTGIFALLENPLLPNLTIDNKNKVEENRKKALRWLLEGWPETERRIRANNLLYVSARSLKEFAQLALEMVGEKSKLLGEAEKPTDDAVRESHNKHLSKLKPQFPELFQSTTSARPS